MSYFYNNYRWLGIQCDCFAHLLTLGDPLYGENTKSDDESSSSEGESEIQDKSTDTNEVPNTGGVDEVHLTTLGVAYRGVLGVILEVPFLLKALPCRSFLGSTF